MDGCVVPLCVVTRGSMGVVTLGGSVGSLGVVTSGSVGSVGVVVGG